MILLTGVVDAWWSEAQSDRIGAFVSLGVVLFFLFILVSSIFVLGFLFPPVSFVPEQFFQTFFRFVSVPRSI